MEMLATLQVEIWYRRVNACCPPRIFTVEKKKGIQNTRDTMTYLSVGTFPVHTPPTNDRCNTCKFLCTTQEQHTIKEANMIIGTLVYNRMHRACSCNAHKNCTNKRLLGACRTFALNMTSWSWCKANLSRVCTRDVPMQRLARGFYQLQNSQWEHLYQGCLRTDHTCILHDVAVWWCPRRFFFFFQST